MQFYIEFKHCVFHYFFLKWRFEKIIICCTYNCPQVSEYGYIILNRRQRIYSTSKMPSQRYKRAVLPVYFARQDMRCHGSYIFYQEYQEGSSNNASQGILQRASNDINKFFSNSSFVAESALVITWFGMQARPCVRSVYNYTNQMVS